MRIRKIGLWEWEGEANPLWCLQRQCAPSFFFITNARSSTYKMGGFKHYFLHLRRDDSGFEMLPYLWLLYSNHPGPWRRWWDKACLGELYGMKAYLFSWSPFYHLICANNIPSPLFVEDMTETSCDKRRKCLCRTQATQQHILGSDNATHPRMVWLTPNTPRWEEGHLGPS